MAIGSRSRPLVAAIALVAFVVSLFVAAPAYAAPTTGDRSAIFESALTALLERDLESGRITHLGSFTKSNAGKDGAAQVTAGPPVITCYLSLLGPTLSNYGGSIPLMVITANGLVFCTYPISTIGVAVRLEMGGIPLPDERDITLNSATAHAATSAICVDGGWRALTVAVLYAPAGYYPSVAEMAAGSPYANYDC